MHHLKGNALLAGYGHTNAHYEGGINSYLKYLAQHRSRYFVLWKISNANLLFLWRHLPT